MKVKVLICLLLSLLTTISLHAQNHIDSDSIRTAQLKIRIDSLRKITPGVPLVIDGDTLLRLYARKGGLLPEQRVEAAKKQILISGKRLSLAKDSCYVWKGDFFTDIMVGNDVVMSIADEDALWENTTQEELANRYCNVIKAKIEELHEEYGLQKKLIGVMWVIVILLGQWALYRLTRWLHRRWHLQLTRKLLKRAKPINIKDYQLMSRRQLVVAILGGHRILFYIIIILQLLVSIPLIFSAFPETKDIASSFLGYIISPVKDIFHAVVGFLPDLIKIIVIVLCFRFLVKGIKYFTNEIAEGKLKIRGFYPDWAHTTFVILRVLCYSIMFVMIWPLLPNSDSKVFQGVSVFLGIVVSLGSTSIVGNVMAGLVITYMRPFKIGDLIKYGETEGFVIEKTVLVTRIRTRKNEVITIPNSNLLTSQTSNYTVAAHDYGIIVHTKIAISYDVNWQLVRQLLLDAVAATPNLETEPKPFVHVNRLGEVYVEYEVNAYTRNSESLGATYSALRQNILDTFNNAGVEIVLPYLFDVRDNLETQIQHEKQSKQNTPSS